MTKLQPRESGLDFLEATQALLAPFLSYLDCSIFLVPVGERGSWRPLHRGGPSSVVQEFENHLGAWERRRQALQERLSRVEASGQAEASPIFGMIDLVEPVRAGKRHLGWLVAGPFLEHSPSLSFFANQWKALSGQEPGEGDALFEAYVRAGLTVPVLTAPARKALGELLQKFASLLNGNGGARQLSAEARKLLTQAFSRELPNATFHAWALGWPLGNPMPAWGSEITPWMQSELGYSRLPRLAMASLPSSDAGGGFTSLERLARARRFQQAAVPLVRARGNASAMPLGEAGLVVLLAPAPSRDRGKWKLEASQLAESLRRLALEKAGLEVSFGCGEMMDEGKPLGPSLAQALGALSEAASEGSAYGTWKRKNALPEAHGWAGVLQQLAAACAHGGGPELELAFAAHESLLQRLDPADLERRRLRAAAALATCLSRLMEHGAVDGREGARLEAWHEESLQRCSSQAELSRIFRGAIEVLSQLARGKSSVSARLAAQEAARLMRLRYRESLQLKNLAKELGLSAPALSRAYFKEHGEGYETGLRKVRLAEASRLLRSSSLSIAAVARESGFSSASLFIRNFKDQQGVSPGVYRECKAA